MSRLPVRPAMWIAAAIGLALAANLWAADEPLTAKLGPSGTITFSRGATELGTIELNAHGSQWKHAPQITATATVADLPDQGGKRLTGSLPIPNTDGGALHFIETIKPVTGGLHLEYDVAVMKAMKLNGLQLSLELPTAVYAGKDLTMSRLEGEPDVVGFPQETNFTGWSGEAARVEVAKGTPEAIALELRAAADVMVQDLRQWEHPQYELRFPAISNDQGQDVTPEDRFHLDLNLTLAGPVTLVGP